MTYAEKIDGTWIVKTPRQFMTERNASIPAAQLADHGLHEVTTDPRPTGKYVFGPIVDRDGLPVRTWVQQPLTSEDVNRERDRRLLAGVTVTVTGYGDIPMQGRPQDQINTLALKDTARDLQAANVKAPVIPFRDALNVLHMLTPTQVIELANAGKAAASAIYQTAWAMKDGAAPFEAGIPDNFDNDIHWT